MELNVTHGTFKTLKVHIPVLQYDHIRWTQLHCVCKVTSTTSSFPACVNLSPLPCCPWHGIPFESAVWNLLNDPSFGSIPHVFAYLHVFAYVWLRGGPFSAPLNSKKTPLLKGCLIPFMNWNANRSFYFNFISEPHKLSILASYSQSKCQRNKISLRKCLQCNKSLWKLII